MLFLSIGCVYADEGQTAEKKFLDSVSLNVFGDARLRYHTVDQDALPRGAEALSLSVKGGLELSLSDDATFLIELEGSENLIENFNDTLNGQIDRPTISDPASFEVNRLQFQTDILPKTRLTLGRQSIALDDWRFIGHWPFRQNEQTFDAIRAETEIGPGLLNAIYTRRVHRQFGNDSPIGEFEGDSAILNYSLPTPVGRLAAFYYGLDLNTGESADEGPSLLDSSASSATTGIRINEGALCVW